VAISNQFVEVMELPALTKTFGQLPNEIRKKPM
jgi:hypothetical protein